MRTETVRHQVSTQQLEIHEQASREYRTRAHTEATGLQLVTGVPANQVVQVVAAVDESAAVSAQPVALPPTPKKPATVTVKQLQHKRVSKVDTAAQQQSQLLLKQQLSANQYRAPERRQLDDTDDYDDDTDFQLAPHMHQKAFRDGLYADFHCRIAGK